MFTGNETPSAELIWGDIATGAALMTGDIVSIIFERGWYLVASRTNWMQIGTDRDVFAEIVPFPERARNAFRPEIMVSAFASSAVVSQDGVLRHIVGLSPPDESPAFSQIALEFKNWLAFTLTPKDRNKEPAPR